jgi:short-subunit dehydrogenase
LGGVLDVSIDEERVGFRVDILHHDLETIETARLGNLSFIRETFVEVLVNNAVGGGEEGEDM